MIERPDLTARARAVILATASDTERSAALDALGRYENSPTADNYDALHDVLANYGKPPLIGSLAAQRDVRLFLGSAA